MKAKKRDIKPSSVGKPEDVKPREADNEPARAIGSVLTKAANAKVSRRTVMKGGVAVAAVVGVSAVVMKGARFRAPKEQSSATVSIEPLPPVPTYAQQQAVVDPYAAQSVTFTVNGVSQTVFVEPRETLALVLRENLGLVGTKVACNRMSCGACTVLIDGLPHESCQYLALWADGKSIMTTEAGVPTTTAGGTTVPADPVVAALQSAWLQEDGGQCCFCSPGKHYGGHGAPQEQSQPDRRRDQDRAQREPLPLRKLPEHHRLHSACGTESWRWVNTDDTVLISVRQQDPHAKGPHTEDHRR